MKTATISLRFPQSEVARLEHVAQSMDMERPVFLKQALKRGTQDLLFEHACKAYRNGEATLSRCAEMAGISLRDMILRMRGARLELTYDAEDLAKDLRA